MSWLARSIANTLHLNDEDGGLESEATARGEIKDDCAEQPRGDRWQGSDVPLEYRRLSCSGGDAVYGGEMDGDRAGDGDQARGVKEDLSELGDSLKRQFWGVASFLAPPPTPPPPPRLSCRRSGFFESVPEPDLAVSGDAGCQDNLNLENQYRESDQHLELAHISESEVSYNDIIADAMGITEEVLAFASNIAHHPETWLDFPLLEEEEFDDFEISDAQYKHILAVELLASRLAALRIELCPVHMSEGYFWMVYFVLLHSRLNKHDADLLSSPQLVQARSRWMQELQKQTKEQSHNPYISSSPREYSLFHEESYYKMAPFEQPMLQASASNEVENQHPYESEADDDLFIKKNLVHVLEEEKGSVAGPSSTIPVLDDTDDDDDWVKDDSDLAGYCPSSVVLNEEDISFSDLEDDLDSTMPIKSRTSSASNEVNLDSKTS